MNKKIVFIILTFVLLLSFGVISNEDYCPSCTLIDDFQKIELINITEINITNIGNTNMSGTFIGNITVTGFMHVGADTISSFTGHSLAGDVAVGNRLIVSRGINSYPYPYGIGLASHEYGKGLNITSWGGTATLNATTKTVCDTTNPFNSFNKKMVFIVYSSTPSFEGATGEIEEYINTSCVELSFASAGSDSIVDATDMAYYVVEHPVFMALDNGMISSKVGENSDAKFEIEIPNGTGFHGFFIEDVSGADQHQSVTIDTDIKNYTGIVSHNNYMFSSTGASMTHIDMYKLEVDQDGISDSLFHFIDMSIIGVNESTKNTIDAIHFHGEFDSFISHGEADTLSSAYYETTNVTANFTDVGNDATVFINDDEFIYIGSTTNFTVIAIELATESSKNLIFNYFYCNGSEYLSLPTIADTTNGFQISGTITFGSPSDRGNCNTTYSGTGFSDPTEYSYIALQRTANNIVTDPIVDEITISGSSTQMKLTEDLLLLNPRSTPPETCNAGLLGAFFVDSGVNLPCFCDGTSWKQMDDFSTECS